MFKNIKGLGDLLALVFEPIQSLMSRFKDRKGVDTPKTQNVSESIVVPRKSCGCQERKEKLNKIFPFS